MQILGGGGQGQHLDGLRLVQIVRKCIQRIVAGRQEDCVGVLERVRDGRAGDQPGGVRVVDEGGGVFVAGCEDVAAAQGGEIHAVDRIGREQTDDGGLVEEAAAVIVGAVSVDLADGEALVPLVQHQVEVLLLALLPLIHP